MDTILLVSTGSTFYTPLDLYDNVSIQVDIQEGDLSGFERRSNYSKSFRIPATENNSKIFKHFYEVNGTDYNPYAALPCVVQLNGNDIFQGTLRLNAVYRTNNTDEYEVYILQELVDFNLTLGDIKLQDLDWTEYNHEVNYDNITASWSATTGNTAGLFGGDIIYPMINYGLSYDASGNTEFDYCIGSSPCFSNSANALQPEIWRPSIRIKAIMDKIFDYAGYSYNSDFFESPYFKLLYMDLGYDNELGISTPTEDENLNLFKVYTEGDTEYINYPKHISGTYFPFRTLTPDGYDYLNNYILGETNITIDDPTNYFAVPKNGTYGFALRFAYTKVGSFNEDLRFEVRVRKSSTIEGLSTGSTIFSDTYDADDTTQQALEVFSDTLSSGEYVGVFIKSISVGSAGYNQFQTLIIEPYSSDYPKPLFQLYQSPTLTISDFEGNKNMPDLKAIDFIRSIVKMFNLVFISNETKTITIEPFDYYFQNQNRTVKDWSNKLDTSQSYTIKPFGFELPKTQNYTYQSGGEEVHSKYYEYQFNEIYGERILIKPSNILQGEETLDVIFRPTPTDCIDGSDWIIIPEFYKNSDDGRIVPTETAPHLFFWLGNRYTYTSFSASTSSQWYFSSGSTDVAWTTYPAVSHLSALNSGQTQSDFSDLNFRGHWDFFANNNTYINQFTGNNLFNNFHSQLYNEKYSNEARKLIGRFILSPNDIGQLNLRDKIFVKDSMYRIESIRGASLTEKKSTEVVLIKELNGGFYWTESPVDNPSIPPNDPIP